MLRTWLFTLFLTLSFSTFLQAQVPYLSVQNPHRFKRERIYPGDTLILRVKNDKIWHGGTLQRVHENSIILSGDSIMMDSITGILMAHNGAVRHWVGAGRLLGSIIAIGGPLMLTVNRAYYEVYPVVNATTFIVAGAGVLIRIVLKPLAAKKYKIGKRWEVKRLEVVGE